MLTKRLASESVLGGRTPGGDGAVCQASRTTCCDIKTLEKRSPRRNAPLGDTLPGDFLLLHGRVAGLLPSIVPCSATIFAVYHHIWPPS